MALSATSVTFHPIFVSLKGRAEITMRNTSTEIVDFAWFGMSAEEESPVHPSRPLPDGMDLMGEGHVCPVFSVSPSRGLVYPRGSVTFSVIFAPQHAGTFQDCIYLEVSGVMQRFPLSLAARAVGPALTLDCDVLDVGTVVFGQTRAWTVRLTNGGGVEGEYAVELPVSVFGSCMSCTPSSGLLKPSDYVDLTISLTPDTLGSVAEAVSVHISGTSEPVQVLVKGQVIAPKFSVSPPESIDFGVVSYGFPSDSELSLTNSSPVPVTFELRLRDIMPAPPRDSPESARSMVLSDESPGTVISSSPSADFTVLPTVITAKPSSTVKAVVSFLSTTQRASGVYSALLDVGVVGVSRQIECIRIVGRAVVPTVRLSPPLIDLGQCSLEYGAQADVTLTNLSDRHLARFEFLSSKDAAANLATVEISRPEGVLQVGESVVLTLTTTPHVLGRSRVPIHLSIVGGALLEGMLSLHCVGPSLTLSTRDALDFGRVPVLSRVAQPLTLSNRTLVPCRYAVALANAANSRFSVTPSEFLSGILNASQSVTMNVSVMVNDTKAHSDRLTIVCTDDSPDPVSIEEDVISLTARGTGSTLVVRDSLDSSGEILTSLPTAAADDHTVDLGDALTISRVLKRVTIENRGVLEETVSWAPEREGAFVVVPPSATIAPGHFKTFIIGGANLAPCDVEELWTVRTASGKGRTASDLFKCRFRVRFVAPGLSLTHNGGKKVSRVSFSVTNTRPAESSSDFPSLGDNFEDFANSLMEELTARPGAESAVPGMVIDAANSSTVPLHVDLSVMPPFFIVPVSGVPSLTPADGVFDCAHVYDDVCKVQPGPVTVPAGGTLKLLLGFCAYTMDTNTILGSPAASFSSKVRFAVRAGTGEASETARASEDAVIRHIQAMHETFKSKGRVGSIRHAESLPPLALRAHVLNVAATATVSVPCVTLDRGKCAMACVAGGSASSTVVLTNTSDKLQASYTWSFARDDDADDFISVEPVAGVLPPGASITATVTFLAPASEVTIDTALCLSVLDGIDRELEVSATSSDLRFSVSTDHLAFGTFVCGRSDNGSITVANNGGVALPWNIAEGVNKEKMIVALKHALEATDDSVSAVNSTIRAVNKAGEEAFEAMRRLDEGAVQRVLEHLPEPRPAPVAMHEDKLAVRCVPSGGVLSPGESVDIAVSLFSATPGPAVSRELFLEIAGLPPRPIAVSGCPALPRVVLDSAERAAVCDEDWESFVEQAGGVAEAESRLTLLSDQHMKEFRPLSEIGADVTSAEGLAEAAASLGHPVAAVYRIDFGTAVTGATVERSTRVSSPEAEVAADLAFRTGFVPQGVTVVPQTVQKGSVSSVKVTIHTDKFEAGVHHFIVPFTLGGQTGILVLCRVEVVRPEIGVFEDEKCAVQARKLACGHSRPGIAVKRTFFVKNLSEVPVVVQASLGSLPSNALRVKRDEEGPFVLECSSLTVSPHGVAPLALTYLPPVGAEFSKALVKDGKIAQKVTLTVSSPQQRTFSATTVLRATSSYSRPALSLSANKVSVPPALPRAIARDINSVLGSVAPVTITNDGDEAVTVVCDGGASEAARVLAGESLASDGSLAKTEEQVSSPEPTAGELAVQALAAHEGVGAVFVHGVPFCGQKEAVKKVLEGGPEAAVLVDFAAKFSTSEALEDLRFAIAEFKSTPPPTSRSKKPPVHPASTEAAQMQIAEALGLSAQNFVFVNLGTNLIPLEYAAKACLLALARFDKVISCSVLVPDPIEPPVDKIFAEIEERLPEVLVNPAEVPDEVASDLSESLINHCMTSERGVVALGRTRRSVQEALSALKADTAVRELMSHRLEAVQSEKGTLCDIVKAFVLAHVAPKVVGGRPVSAKSRRAAPQLDLAIVDTVFSDARAWQWIPVQAEEETVVEPTVVRTVSEAARALLSTPARPAALAGDVRDGGFVLLDKDRYERAMELLLVSPEEPMKRPKGKKAEVVPQTPYEEVMGRLENPKVLAAFEEAVVTEISLDASCSRELLVRFSGDDVGLFKTTIPFAACQDYARVASVALRVAGSVLIPDINRDPKVFAAPEKALRPVSRGTARPRSARPRTANVRPKPSVRWKNDRVDFGFLPAPHEGGALVPPTVTRAADTFSVSLVNAGPFPVECKLRVEEEAAAPVVTKGKKASLPPPVFSVSEEAVTVPEGQTRVKVTAKPTATGEQTGTLIITVTNNDEPLRIPLVVRGSHARCELSTDTLDLNRTATGLAVSETVAVKNPSDLPIAFRVVPGRTVSTAIVAERPAKGKKAAEAPALGPPVEDDPNAFTFDKMQGVIEPGDETNITVTFKSDKVARRALPKCAIESWALPLPHVALPPVRTRGVMLHVAEAAKSRSNFSVPRPASGGVNPIKRYPLSIVAEGFALSVGACVVPAATPPGRPVPENVIGMGLVQCGHSSSRRVVLFNSGAYAARVSGVIGKSGRKTLAISEPEFDLGAYDAEAARSFVAKAKGLVVPPDAREELSSGRLTKTLASLLGSAASGAGAVVPGVHVVEVTALPTAEGALDIPIKFLVTDTSKTGSSRAALSVRVRITAEFSKFSFCTAGGVDDGVLAARHVQFGRMVHGASASETVTLRNTGKFDFDWTLHAVGATSAESSPASKGAKGKKETPVTRLEAGPLTISPSSGSLRPGEAAEVTVSTTVDAVASPVVDVTVALAVKGSDPKKRSCPELDDTTVESLHALGAATVPVPKVKRESFSIRSTSVQPTHDLAGHLARFTLNAVLPAFCADKSVIHRDQRAVDDATAVENSFLSGRAVWSDDHVVLGVVSPRAALSERICFRNDGDLPITVLLSLVAVGAAVKGAKGTSSASPFSLSETSVTVAPHDSASVAVAFTGSAAQVGTTERATLAAVVRHDPFLGQAAVKKGKGGAQPVAIAAHEDFEAASAVIDSIVSDPNLVKSQRLTTNFCARVEHAEIAIESEHEATLTAEGQTLAALIKSELGGRAGGRAVSAPVHSLSVGTVATGRTATKTATVTNCGRLPVVVRCHMARVAAAVAESPRKGAKAKASGTLKRIFPSSIDASSCPFKAALPEQAVTLAPGASSELTITYSPRVSLAQQLAGVTDALAESSVDHYSFGVVVSVDDEPVEGIVSLSARAVASRMSLTLNDEKIETVILGDHVVPKELATVVGSALRQSVIAVPGGPKKPLTADSIAAAFKATDIDMRLLQSVATYTPEGTVIRLKSRDVVPYRVVLSSAPACISVVPSTFWLDAGSFVDIAIRWRGHVESLQAAASRGLPVAPLTPAEIEAAVLMAESGPEGAADAKTLLTEAARWREHRVGCWPPQAVMAACSLEFDATAIALPGPALSTVRGPFATGTTLWHDGLRRAVWKETSGAPERVFEPLPEPEVRPLPDRDVLTISVPIRGIRGYSETNIVPGPEDDVDKSPMEVVFPETELHSVSERDLELVTKGVVIPTIKPLIRWAHSTKCAFSVGAPLSVASDDLPRRLSTAASMPGVVSVKSVSGLLESDGLVAVAREVTGAKKPAGKSTTGYESRQVINMKFAPTVYADFDVPLSLDMSDGSRQEVILVGSSTVPSVRVEGGSDIALETAPLGFEKANRSEIIVDGSGRVGRCTIRVFNPTGAPWDYVVERVSGGADCVAPEGFVDAGSFVDLPFEYASASAATEESFFNLKVPSIDATIPLAVVAVCRPVDVSLSTSRVQLAAVRKGDTTSGSFTIVNSSFREITFSLDESLRRLGPRSGVSVAPVVGSIPANSSVEVAVGLTLRKIDSIELDVVVPEISAPLVVQVRAESIE